jgi:hypothetical protein
MYRIPGFVYGLWERARACLQSGLNDYDAAGFCFFAGRIGDDGIVWQAHPSLTVK